MSTGSELKNYSLEVSYGSRWINLNDHDAYILHAESTGSRQKNYRQVKVQSPIVEGDILLHSVAEMVTETIKVWVYGNHQVELEERLIELETLFEQFRYQVRVTKNEYREVWDCRATENMTIEIEQASLHNMMGLFTAAVMRQPTIHREVAP